MIPEISIAVGITVQVVVLYGVHGLVKMHQSREMMTYGEALRYSLKNRFSYPKLFVILLIIPVLVSVVTFFLLTGIVSVFFG